MLNTGIKITIEVPIIDLNNFTITRRELNSNEIIAVYDENFNEKIKVGEYNKSLHIIDKNNPDVDLCVNNHILCFRYVSDELVSFNGIVHRISDISSNQDYFIKVSVKKNNNTNFNLKKFGIFAYDGKNPNNEPTGLIVKVFRLNDRKFYNINGINNILYYDITTQNASQYDFYYQIAIKRLSDTLSMFSVGYLVEV
ncbi:MAG: hypothetical protein QW607_07975 [Desulfurococcaceae archaeon]